MTITYLKGDLLNCKEQVFVHGCNAQGVMGSGVAKLVKKKYPDMYDAYCKVFIDGYIGLHLGEITVSELHDGKFGINAITQKYYGREPGKVYVSYEAIQECFERINRWMDGHKMTDIAMPMIGAGLGGGDWNKIISIVERELIDKNIVVYVL